MSPDLTDLLRAFSAHDVEALVVGAHALAAHGHIRATKDLDVWIRPSRENAERAHRALAAFGASLRDMTVDDLATPGTVFQIGVSPFRVDVVTKIDGVSFDEAWPERVPVRFGDVSTHVLSRRLLIRNKLATGRLQDRADVEALERGSEGE